MKRVAQEWSSSLVVVGFVVLAITLTGPATVHGQSKGGTLNLTMPALPDTDVNQQPEFDYFAWNSFIAMNWPALFPAENNNQRGFPNVKSQFTAATGRPAFPDLSTPEAVLAATSANDPNDPTTVWETLKEKREVLNFGLNGTVPPAWNSVVNYGTPRPARTAGQPKPMMIPGLKLLPQIGKGHSFMGFDSFDETLEVASESLEPTLPPLPGQPPAPNPVLNRLVGPRVWRGQPTTDNENVVRYEVKVNYDFYLNVINNKYYVVEDQGTAKKPKYVNVNSVAAAAAGKIKLPYRTSANLGPKGQNSPSPIHDYVLGYSASNAAALYAKATSTSSMLPPLTGAVHLKAAWIQLIPGKDNPADYHTAVAQYYVQGKDTIETQYGLFGLIGLHIIQRVHTVGPYSTTNGVQTGGPKTVGNPRGGTFIFATFEHVSNDSAGYTYSNFYDPDDDPNLVGQPAVGWYPNIDPAKKNPAFPVVRRFQPLPGTVAVNTAVRNAIIAANPKSVWRNYQLIGTQFMAVDGSDVNPLEANPDNTTSTTIEAAKKATDPTVVVETPDPNDPTAIGQPYFLANLVIETNDGLQHFQGLPPKKAPIAKFRGVGVKPNNTVHYNHNTPNVSFRRKPVNMGGCMGCHGVAQQAGYSFSFVLLGGYAGTAIDVEPVGGFEIPGAAENPPPKN